MPRKKGEKFLDPNEIGSMGEKWSHIAKALESGLSQELEKNEEHYPVSRIEDADSSDESIQVIHDISFIKEVIPEILKRKKKGEKVKVLDVGGGVGLYADQIRDEFGDAVAVFSTGISKKHAKRYRRSAKEGGVSTPSPSLHKNDLKWRSILELSNFEEFDLIIDTYGEAYWSEAHIKQTEAGEEDVEQFEQYVMIVSSKLLPGGAASIAPAHFPRMMMTREGYEDSLGKLGEKYGVIITSYPREDDHSESEVMRIVKPLKE